MFREVESLEFPQATACSIGNCINRLRQDGVCICFEDVRPALEKWARDEYNKEEETEEVDPYQAASTR